MFLRKKLNCNAMLRLTRPNSGSNRYFMNERELSEDEYFAIALPYYSAKLRIASMEGEDHGCGV
jgi:hypothetical protein